MQRQQGGGKGTVTFLKGILGRAAQGHRHVLLPAQCVIFGYGFLPQDDWEKRTGALDSIPQGNGHY